MVTREIDHIGPRLFYRAPQGLKADGTTKEFFLQTAKGEKWILHAPNWRNKAFYWSNKTENAVQNVQKSQLFEYFSATITVLDYLNRLLVVKN